MTTGTDSGPWLAALRGSHDRLVTIVNTLDRGDLTRQSYDSEWSIAQVLSHLGSGAEIFSLSLTAGLAGGDPPGREHFQPIWDVWNDRSPEEQTEFSVAANEELVSRLEGLSEEKRAAFHITMFGMPMDLAGMLRMRLSEHAVHTWDVAVAVDPAARVDPAAVSLLIDGIPQMMAWLGKKADKPAVIAVRTTSPERAYTLDTGGVSLTAGEAGSPDGSLDLTAEALLRLVYGRLDDTAVDTGEVRTSNVDLADLHKVFPGF